MNQYYAFYLDEPACPAFCSFSRLYIGTIDEVKQVIENLRKEGIYEDTVKAFDDFLNGNEKTEHCIAYQRIPVLTPVEVIAKGEVITLEAKEWDHLNAWECPYRMKFDGATVAQMVVKTDGEYHRVMKATIRNLHYENTVGQWSSLTDAFWGNRCVIKVNKKNKTEYSMTNILYEVESSSEDEAEEIAKMNDPEEIIFEHILDEVFGDG